MKANCRRTFYMVRHGKSLDNEAGLVSGDDTILSRDGQQEADRLSKVFAKRFPRSDDFYLVVSGLPRAKETAAFMLDRSLPRVVTDEGLNEIQNGVMAGLSLEELEKRKQAYRAHIEAGGDPIVVWPKGAERFSRHAERVVLSVVYHLLQCPEEKAPVFVSHHISMEQVAEALGVKGCKFENATMYQYECDEAGQWKISEVGLSQAGDLTYNPVGKRSFPGVTVG